MSGLIEKHNADAAYRISNLKMVAALEMQKWLSWWSKKGDHVKAFKLFKQHEEDIEQSANWMREAKKWERWNNE